MENKSYSKLGISLIHIEKCQIKSAQKFERVCELLDELEKEIGIREVEISFKNMFVCPDINLEDYTNSQKPMEKLASNILKDLKNDSAFNCK